MKFLIALAIAASACGTGAAPADRVFLRGLDAHACRVEHRDDVRLWSLGAYTGVVGTVPATIVHVNINQGVRPTDILVATDRHDVLIRRPAFVRGDDFYYALPADVKPKSVHGFIVEWEGGEARFGQDPTRQIVQGQEPMKTGIAQTPWIYESTFNLGWCRSRTRHLAAADRELLVR